VAVEAVIKVFLLMLLLMMVVQAVRQAIMQPLVLWEMARRVKAATLAQP
tara:strand:+ start:184 stop:330 length:147 start_codon:yes stop_codon:yes gene_type:complete